MEDLLAMYESGAYRAAVQAFDERMPPRRQPAWAARLLEAFRPRHAFPREVEVVLAIAANEDRWPQAHAAFQAIRHLTLAEEQGAGDWDPDLLLLAEWAAKVVYNASGEDAPFKPDSGIALVAQALRMAAAADDPGFQDHVRGLVARVGWD